MTWTCHFCGGSEEPTKEHVFPVWLLEELKLTQEQADAIHYTILGTTKSERSLTHNGMVLGKVCGRCNHGWMSSLESNVREPLQAARSRGVLSTKDGETLATWAFKTAIVLNRWSNYRKLVPDAHFRWLEEHGAPPLEVVVDIGYLKDGWHEGIEGARRELGYQQSMIQSWTLPESEATTETVKQYQEKSYVIVIMVDDCVLRVAYCPVPEMDVVPLSKLNWGDVFRLWPLHQDGLMRFCDLEAFKSMTHFSMAIQAVPAASGGAD